MAINFSQVIYAATQNTFSRPVTITPTKSQPSVPAYDARGILDTEALDVLAEDTSSFSDTRVVLDILDSDYTVVPIQGDTVFIPAHIGMPEAGDFVIIETKPNGGGETTLQLRSIVETKPA